MKDTIIQLYSDHGAHTAVYDYPYIPDNSRLVESTHPLFTYIVPKTLPSRNRKILFENQQNFMSPYDAYSSLITIAKGKTSRSKHTISYPIIAEVLPLDRDCTNTTMFLGPCWCYMDSNLGDYYLNKMELFRFETDVWNTSNRYNAKEIF